MAQRKFRHHSAQHFSAGSIVTVTTVPTPYNGAHTFNLDPGGYYWGTENNTPAVDQLSVGDQFKVISKDATFITVEDVKVAKAKGETVSISKDKIVAASKKSKAAETLLKGLFPECFPKPEVKPNWEAVSASGTGTLVNSNGELLLERRGGGKYDGHTWLNSKYEWTIEKDGVIPVLVAREK